MEEEVAERGGWVSIKVSRGVFEKIEEARCILQQRAAASMGAEIAIKLPGDAIMAMVLDQWLHTQRRQAEIAMHYGPTAEDKAPPPEVAPIHAPAAKGANKKGKR